MMTTTLFQNRHFIALSQQDGLLADLSSDPFPTKVFAWGFQTPELVLSGIGTHYGFVYEGVAKLTSYHSETEITMELRQGMFFCIPGAARIYGGCGLIVTSLDFKGLFSISGPIEEKGRLRYIDGCSDSLLIPPVIKGDPCLNHLHFPTGISQTRHTHPSLRIGIIAKGQGRCVVPANDDGTGPDISIPLVPGQMFIIPTNGQHSFFTNDSTMDVIAYHPDSDFGPEHDDHPMVNRTIVDGVSASRIEHIRTTLSLFNGSR